MFSHDAADLQVMCLTTVHGMFNLLQLLVIAIKLKNTGNTEIIEGAYKSISSSNTE